MRNHNAKSTFGVDRESAIRRLQEGRASARARWAAQCNAMIEEGGVVRVEYHHRLSGWAVAKNRTIRVPWPTSRRRLYIVAHEVGHIVHGHNGRRASHRKEFEAEVYAHDALRRHGLPVPRKATVAAKRNVARRIRQAVRCGAKRVDREAFEWARDHVPADVRAAIQSGRVQLANLGPKRSVA